jgi:hypothetical protein
MIPFLHQVYETFLIIAIAAEIERDLISQRKAAISLVR